MKKNVLVFPCGSEIGLEINRALANSTHFDLYGANNMDDHGKYVYNHYIPMAEGPEEPGFIEELNNLIATYQIDFIIPAHDTAIVFMAEHEALIHATIITSSAETCSLCRSKGDTYALFKHLIATPLIYQTSDELVFPLFLKPDIGQGSKGTCMVNSREEMDFYLSKDSTLLILEYLPGKEYTIDCFTNSDGDLLFAEGRVRNRIMNGISVSSWHVKNEQFQRLAKRINQTLNFRGVWFFQVKEREDGELVLMEISPRIAGTMALFRSVGVNFIQLSLYDRMGHPVKIIHHDFHSEVDRALFARFRLDIEYDFVYVDFDDTIIVNNLINTTLLKFLYQCKNSKKKLILITKHIYDIRETLNTFAISPLLFDEVIQLNKTQQKFKFIMNKNSIFIDDSFEERSHISQHLNIPTFGLDAIESLLSWKV